MDDDAVLALVNRFNTAWNDHDLDAALALVTEDCLFEATGPAPDGQVHRGRDAVRAAWEPVFADARSRIETEEVVVISDRVVQTWRYDWGDGHVRGIDLIDVVAGPDGPRVAVKRSYVKG